MNDDPSSRKPRGENGADDGGSLMSLLRGLLSGMRRSEDPVREAIAELVEEDDSPTSSLSTHERLMLLNVLRLRDVTAYDVMVPRVDIIGVEVETPLSEVVETIARCGHSRLPVYRGTLDEVIGMVHVKDVLPIAAKGRTVHLQHLLRKVPCISPAVRVLELFLDMRAQRYHMALVVDEYGGIDGLVTIEDLIEQIVGDIEDEHETDAEPAMVMGDDGVLIADARVALEDFEERFGISFSEEDKEDTDTLGGLVFRISGKVPSRGEIIVHPSGLEFEVLQSDPRRIHRLRVYHIAPRPPQTASDA